MSLYSIHSIKAMPNYFIGNNEISTGAVDVEYHRTFCFTLATTDKH